VLGSGPSVGTSSTTSPLTLPSGENASGSPLCAEAPGVSAEAPPSSASALTPSSVVPSPSSSKAFRSSSATSNCSWTSSKNPGGKNLGGPFLPSPPPLPPPPPPSPPLLVQSRSKTSGVGGEQRGYDGGKKVRGRKRHLLVDTEGLVLKAKVHSAKVPDQDGIKLLLKSARERLPRLLHLWVDAGYQGRGKEWVEKELGLSVEVVHRTPKPTSKKMARIWAEEWAKEGRQIDWQKLLPRRGFERLPRRWVVERTFSWLSQNRRMSKDYERLCATSEAFIYAAMTRLIVRRLASA
jgi:transposase